jgi:hypothetical protein
VKAGPAATAVSGKIELMLASTETMVMSLAESPAEPPPDTETEFVKGDPAVVDTLTVTVMGG